MSHRTGSNYSRKRDYLVTLNNRSGDDAPTKAEGATKAAKIWGFDFPVGEKPWVRK